MSTLNHKHSLKSVIYQNTLIIAFLQKIFSYALSHFFLKKTPFYLQPILLARFTKVIYIKHIKRFVGLPSKNYNINVLQVEY